MKVLAAVDGSPSSLDAVSLIGRLINPAVDEVAVYFSPLEIRKRLPGQSEKVVEGAVAAIFDEACSLLPQGMTHKVEAIVSSKPAAVGILETAEGWHADLLVLGARGLSTVERLFLGSVSRAVLHGSQLPVLIVRTAFPSDRPLKVLACHRDASAAALAAAVGRLHWPEATQGRVIGVTESLLAGPLPEWLEQRVRDPDTAAIADAWQKEHDDEVQTLAGKLQAFAGLLPEVFRRQEPILVEGNAGDRIVETAKANGDDLIVIGRTPTDAFSRWLLGSTSEAVIMHAPASVLVVPVPK